MHIEYDEYRDPEEIHLEDYFHIIDPGFYFAIDIPIATGGVILYAKIKIMSAKLFRKLVQKLMTISSKIPPKSIANP